MKKTLLFLLAGTFLSGIACSDNPAYPSNPEQILPLKVGNAWVLAIVTYDSAGNTISNGTDSIWVDRDTTINGQTYYVLAEKAYDPRRPVQTTTWGVVRNTTMGLVRWTSSNDTLLFKYPGEVGESSITGIGISIATATGTFPCVRYEFTIASTMKRVDFLSSGTGFVKSEIHLPLQSGSFYLFQEITLTNLIKL